MAGPSPEYGHKIPGFSIPGLTWRLGPIEALLARRWLPGSGLGSFNRRRNHFNSLPLGGQYSSTRSHKHPSAIGGYEGRLRVHISHKILILDNISLPNGGGDFSPQGLLRVPRSLRAENISKMKSPSVKTRPSHGEGGQTLTAEVFFPRGCTCTTLLSFSQRPSGPQPPRTPTK